MNEGGNGVETPQAQGQITSQPAQPTSAVNAGFDASKFGSGKKQKPEKNKKVKEKKSKEVKNINQSSQDGSREKTRRPTWFWVVLGILGVAVMGAVIWAAVTVIIPTLVAPEGSKSIPTDITLGDSYDSDSDGENSAVEKYLAQLREISGTNEDAWPGSGSSNQESGDGTGGAVGDVQSANSDQGQQGSGARGISDAREATKNAVSLSSDRRQQNAIRAAEMIVLFQHSEYQEVVNAIGQINFDTLSPKEQSLTYAAIKSSYVALGNMEEAEKYRRLEEQADIKLHGGN